MSKNGVVRLEVPVGALTSAARNAAQREFRFRMRFEHSTALAAIARGLNDAGERLERTGQIVQSSQDALEWLLEQVNMEAGI